MDVPLAPELENQIASEVSAGHFASAGDLVAAAVQHYPLARDLGEAFTRDEIEEKIARGLAQIERGETIDGDEAFLQLRSELAERRRA